MKTIFHHASLLGIGFIATIGGACQNKVSDRVEVEQELNLSDHLEESPADNHEIQTISGKVLYYKSDQSACLFVDAVMVEQGITEGLDDMATSESCTDTTYGPGAIIRFTELDKNSAYPYAPEENVLLHIQGYWKTEINPHQEPQTVFYATEYEPFF